MKRAVALISVLLLLLGCTGQGLDNSNATQPVSPKINQSVLNTTEKTPPPTISGLKGCVLGLSFSYRVTTTMQGRDSVSLITYATGEGGVVNGKNSILKTIGLSETSDGKVGATTKEWDAKEDCSCLKRETVAEYEGQKISLKDACPKETAGAANSPKISYAGEERVDVLAYSGMAKRYELSFENESASDSYWLAPGIKVPVRHFYSAGETQVLEELSQYK
jgi:hypothetical protein